MIHNPRSQNTISHPVTLGGVGYWSGLHANVELRPANPNSGVTFVRADLASQPRIAVTAENCVDIPRRTSIESGTACVEMIEHIMSALTGLQIDNCEVWVDRAELPAFDGSSQPVVDALTSVSIVDQNVPKPTLIIEDEVNLETESGWIRALPNPNGLKLTYHLDYEFPAIGKQSIELAVTPETYQRELAAARTFLMESEAEWLRAQGLGRNVSFQDLLVFGSQGVIGNQLRFSDECVRHKALDVVGDIGVAGFDVQGHIIAYKSGHRLNGLFVKKLTDVFHTSRDKRLSA